MSAADPVALEPCRDRSTALTWRGDCHRYAGGTDFDRRPVSRTRRWNSESSLSSMALADSNKPPLPGGIPGIGENARALACFGLTALAAPCPCPPTPAAGERLRGGSTSGVAAAVRGCRHKPGDDERNAAIDEAGRASTPSGSAGMERTLCARLRTAFSDDSIESDSARNDRWFCIRLLHMALASSLPCLLLGRLLPLLPWAPAAGPPPLVLSNARFALALRAPGVVCLVRRVTTGVCVPRAVAGRVYVTLLREAELAWAGDLTFAPALLLRDCSLTALPEREPALRSLRPDGVYTPAIKLECIFGVDSVDSAGGHGNARQYTPPFGAVCVQC